MLTADPCEFSVFPQRYRDRIVDLAQDQQALAQMALLIESSDDAIFRKDKNAIIRSWNYGAERLYGYKQKEIIGRSAVILYPKDRKGEIEEIMEAVNMGIRVEHLQTQRLTKNGRVIDVSATILPVFEPRSGVSGALTIVRDISEFKELERNKDAFIGMTNHELKTPITTLKAYTEILQAQFDHNPEAKKYLGKMEQQIDRLGRLVSELLDLSRIEGGKLYLEKRRFSLDELTKEVVEDLSKISLKHRITIRGKIGQPIYGDRDRISQVLTNLLTNAIKYSPDGDSVEIDLRADKNKAIVSVKDYGIGIGLSSQGKVFDRFFRARGISERTFPGLGVGLYITGEIIRRHGGRIWLESKKGYGSTFHVSVPFS